jgi:hypothetical protein
MLCYRSETKNSVGFFFIQKLYTINSSGVSMLSPNVIVSIVLSVTEKKEKINNYKLLYKKRYRFFQIQIIYLLFRL